jgi:pentatricopeptide repeat protein
MSQHDNQGRAGGDAGAPDEFSDMEIAPFSLDAGEQNSEGAQPAYTQPPTGQFKDAEVEFAPFMFSDGSATTVQASPAEQSDVVSETSESAAQDAAFSGVPSPVLAGSAGTADTIAPTTAMDLSTNDASGGEANRDVTSGGFAVTGHDVPMPSYLHASSFDAPAHSEAMPRVGTGPLGQPVQAEAATPGTPGTNGTEPSGSTLPHSTNPLGTDSLSAMNIDLSTAARPRGNTGPLGSATTATASASWSDSSLASIEDFSSILIALQAGKRLRRSGPLDPSMLAQTQPVESPAPTSTPSTTAEHAVPEWAAQAVAEPEAHPQTGAPVQTQEHGTPAWAGGQWEPQLPADHPSGPVALSPQEELSAQAAAVWGVATAADGTNQEIQPFSLDEAPGEAYGAAAEWQTPDMAQQSATSAVAESPAVAAAPAMPEHELLKDIPLSEEFGGLTPEVAGMLNPENEDSFQALAERGLTGDELQFESFMFDEGASAPLTALSEADIASLPNDLGPAFDPTPYISPTAASPTPVYADFDQSFMPAAPDNVSAVVGAAPEPSTVSGPLPFWLQDSEARAVPGEAQLNASVAAQPMPEMYTMPSQPSAPSALPAFESMRPAPQPRHTVENTADDEFTQLPPIEPFDFASLQDEEDDDQLGFNTEELSGLMANSRDSLVVTANLEALADLLGGPWTGEGASSKSQAGMNKVELVVPPAPQDIMDDDYTLDIDEIAETGAEPEGEEKPGGWMATVTSNLAIDSIASLTGNIGKEAAGDVSVEDLGVAPFDYTQLDLSDDELPTSNLSAPITGAMVSNTVNLESRAEAPETPGSRFEEVWSEADGDTSLFMTGAPDEQPEEQEMPTGFLAEDRSRKTAELNMDEVSDDAADADSVEQPVFKARVSRTGTQPGVQSQEPVEVLDSPWKQIAAAATVDSPQADKGAQVQFNEEPPKMPVRGDITTSGPLPSLDGFEDLNEWVERNPHDMGAHIALASAYTQAGEVDTALRVYRRMLRKPNVSDTVLRMIEDDLSELERDATQHARFHQLRGDLFLRLGRHREAIEEYNKLA